MPDRPKLADHARMMRLVEQLSPETRARIAGRLDDRFHEITGTPREDEPTPCSFPPCDAGPGEPCDRHEREQAHAEGEHELCGDDCTAAPEGGAR